MNKEEEMKKPAQPPAAPASHDGSPSQQTDSDHQGHRNERDQSEGNMNNGELGAGLKKDQP